MPRNLSDRFFVAVLSLANAQISAEAPTIQTVVGGVTVMYPFSYVRGVPSPTGFSVRWYDADYIFEVPVPKNP